jgi:hypothetical protein
MAKAKAARRGSGDYRHADPKKRRAGANQHRKKAKVRQTTRRASGAQHRKKAKARQTTRRASGAQHRKKAKVRRMTHRVVIGVLEFASHGLWPLRGSTPNAWLSAEEPVNRVPSSSVRRSLPYRRTC